MGPFPEDGASAHSQYFTKGVKANTCDLVRFPTGYSLYNKSDYKRCVCDSWMMDEEDCIRGNPDQPTSPIPTGTEKDQKTTEDPTVTETEAGATDTYIPRALDETS